MAGAKPAHLQHAMYVPAGNAVGQLATKRGRVEGQSSRTTLQPGVSADAKPVAHAAFLDGDVAVGTVLADSCT